MTDFDDDRSRDIEEDLQEIRGALLGDTIAILSAAEPICLSPTSTVGEAVQAMCFMAGANSIFYGDKLLTTGNPEAEDDRAMLAKLGLRTHASTLTEAQKERCGG